MLRALPASLFPSHGHSPEREDRIHPRVLLNARILDEETEAQRARVICLVAQQSRMNPRLSDSRICSYNHVAMLSLNNLRQGRSVIPPPPDTAMPRHHLLKDKPWAARLSASGVASRSCPIGFELWPDLGTKIGSVPSAGGLAELAHVAERAGHRTSRGVLSARVLRERHPGAGSTHSPHSCWAWRWAGPTITAVQKHGVQRGRPRRKRHRGWGGLRRSFPGPSGSGSGSGWLLLEPLLSSGKGPCSVASVDRTDHSSSSEFFALFRGELPSSSVRTLAS